VAEVKIPYYSVRRNGRGFWEPRPHMRAAGFSMRAGRFICLGDSRGVEPALGCCPPRRGALPCDGDGGEPIP
jgi:hypothetical protein